MRTKALNSNIKISFSANAMIEKGKMKPFAYIDT